MSQDQALLSQPWTTNQLLKGLTPDQLRSLRDYLKYETFNPGEVIIREGEIGNRLFLIENGRVAIEKDGVLLGQKGSGEHFGAMALLDNSPRSADVRATEPTRIQSLDVEKIKEISNEVEQSIYTKMIINHLEDQQSVVRRMNETTIAEVRNKLEEARKRIGFGDFFMTVLAILLLYLFLIGSVLEWKVLRTKAYLYFIGPSFIAIFGGIAYRYVRISGYELSHFGLSWNNWKKHLNTAWWWSVAFMAVITLLKALAIQVVPAFQNTPLFDFHRFYQDNWLTLVLIKFFYVSLAPIQELIVRGILQGGMQHFLTGKNTVLRSIVLSNLIFASGHLLANIWFAIMTLIPGLFWGALYARQGTLTGVSFSHIVIGLYASLVLGIF